MRVLLILCYLVLVTACGSDNAAPVTPPAWVDTYEKVIDVKVAVGDDRGNTLLVTDQGRYLISYDAVYGPIPAPADTLRVRKWSPSDFKLVTITWERTLLTGVISGPLR